MDGIIDSLLSSLPVVFAVLWVMRLLSKRKKAKQSVVKPEVVQKYHSVEEHPAEQPPEPIPVTVISKPIPASEPVHTRRLVEDLVLSDINFESPNEKVSTPVNPYENLSPLAQGMIWSIILDEPLSLKDLEKR